MARLAFPDESYRLTYSLSGRTFIGAPGSTITVYTDAAGSTPADISLTSGGASITGSTVNVDAYSRIPLFYGPPDGTDALYVVVGGGPVTPVYARIDDRLDTVNASLATLATDAGVVHNSGNETIAGTKTFSSAPAVPDGSFTEAKVANLVSDLAAKAATSYVDAADGTRLNWRGAWAATTAYAANDAVSYNGGFYRALTGFTSAGSFNAANWHEIVPQSGTYAAHSRVRMMREQIVRGLVAVGFDKVNSRLYARHESLGGMMAYCNVAADPEMQTWQPIASLGSPVTIYGLWVTAAGSLLVMILDTDGVNKMARSADGGFTWTRVINPIQRYSTALRRSVCQLTNGKLVYAEYFRQGTPSDPYNFNLWVSTDDGATWTVAYTTTDFHGHFHFVAEDTTVANRLITGMGDDDTLCNLRYTDALAAGNTITGPDWPGGVAGTAGTSGDWHVVLAQSNVPAGQTGQTARAVDLIQTSTKWIWAGDTPAAGDENIWARDRTTGVMTEVIKGLGHTAYYALSDGTYGMVLTSARTDNDGWATLDHWAGRVDDASLLNPEWQSVYQVRPQFDATRLDIYAYGPDTNGAFYMSEVNTNANGYQGRITRFRLTDAKQGTESQEQIKARLLYPKPRYLAIPGDQAYDTAADTALPAGGTRVYIQTLRPTVDFLAVKAKVFPGATVSGKCQVVIFREDSTGKMQQILGVTNYATLVASTELSLTFLSSVPLFAGCEYGVGVIVGVTGNSFHSYQANVAFTQRARVITGLTLDATNGLSPTATITDGQVATATIIPVRLTDF